jgi:hypothetical protein
MRRADQPELKIDGSGGQLIVWRLLGEGTYKSAYLERVVRYVIHLTPKSRRMPYLSCDYQSDQKTALKRHM